ncbi:hypothetical protein EV191_101780 [Tamaricihabitans halophyticus]|uniref:Activator of Hsp90 ATPase-like protein n=1 Tax=Tamaricihabitans halophyticus TaxID=1262583 RepID=A0A4R2R2Q7_9PSEU|nr:hypothetical protein [Tamaricihabitans halophyticus]TCP56833.1 hypothetical protein EV191_101780 [Tamaricihabitans halophyticus]
MHKTWTISGGYAEWTLTLHIEPPDAETEPPLTSWPGEQLDHLEIYFHDVVNCYENAREVEHRSYR